MTKDTKNFKVNEFACHCGCGTNNIDQRVLDMCQRIREAVGAPVRVNSGSRCERHNAAVGGVKGSYHTKGYAADLSSVVGSKKLFTTIADLKARGELEALEYCIWYMKKDFVHIDCGGERRSYFEIRA